MASRTAGIPGEWPNTFGVCHVVRPKRRTLLVAAVSCGNFFVTGGKGKRKTKRAKASNHTSFHNAVEDREEMCPGGAQVLMGRDSGKGRGRGKGFERFKARSGLLFNCFWPLDAIFECRTKVRWGPMGRRIHLCCSSKAPLPPPYLLFLEIGIHTLVN